MKKILICIILCCAISAQANISAIPKRDLKKIEFLFDYLINDHDFAYTIFGSKPMSLADIYLELPNNLPFWSKIKTLYFRKKLKNSLEAWEKHKSQFNSKDFIILDSEDGFFNCLTFFIIHKKNLLCLLKAHESIFKQALGESFAPESFIEKLEKKEGTLSEIIHTNDKLLGLMLGYGVRNATLFQERLDLKRAIAKGKKLSLPVDDLTKQLSTVEAKLSDFSEFEENTVLAPLYFLADVFHPETIELKEKYEKERLEIIQLKEKSNLIEFALQRLAE